MNKRLVRIITDLAYSDKHFSLESLALRYSVSTRTIRNDISQINKLLEQNGISGITLIERGQIRLPERFSEILLSLVATDFYEYKLSSDERVVIAATFLVASVGYVTLADLSNTLLVSRTTVIDDLPSIKEHITKAQLTVESRPSKGLIVMGPEHIKRSYLQKIAMMSVPGIEETLSSSTFAALQKDPQLIKKIIVEQAKHAQVSLADTSFEYLCNYIRIAINRMAQGAYVEDTVQTEVNAHTLAAGIYQALSQYLQIPIPESEVSALADILAHLHYLDRTDTDEANVQIQIVTRQFIQALSKELAQDLNDDYEFFEKLSNHLESMYAADGMPFLDDPQLKEILDDKPYVMQAVQKHVSLLLSYDSRKLTDLELAYIGIHVCAAMERKKNRYVALQIIIACHAGIATSQFLIEKLKKYFNFKIVDVVASHQVPYLESDTADLIISTVPLKNSKIEYVIVSPILREEDYVRVSQKIETLQNRRDLPSRTQVQKISTKGIMERIEPIIFESVPERSAQLIRDIRRAIRYYLEEREQSANAFTTPWLHELLDPTHIQLNVSAKDMNEAILASAKPLYTMGYIEARYIDALLEVAKENGPYLQLTRGFALPHDAPESGAVRVGMNLIRLKESVDFGNEELGPVYFVCTLSAVDHATHLKALFNMVRIFANDEARQQLMEAKTPYELRQIIMDFEYQHAQD